MRTLAVFLVLALWTGISGADVHTSKVGKVSINVPKAWQQVMPKDDLVRAVSPDNAVALVMWVVDSTDVKEALTRLEGELYSSVQGLKWVDKTKKLKVNRLRATWIEGAGVNRAATQLDVIVLVAGPTPSKKGVIVMAVVEHDKLEQHQKTIQTTFQSLKPTK